MKHRRWRFELPSKWEDPLSGDLWSRGCTGIHAGSSFGADLEDDASLIDPEGTIQLDVWLPEPLPEAARAFDLDAWRARGVHLVESDIIAEQDWLAAYRASVEPFDVGRRFRVDPRDSELSRGEPLRDDPGSEGRILLRIPAQTAFGTGSHESTRLMIVLLESLALTGRRVLDVGTGSGILALVCRHLGAEKVVGFDLDPAAPLVARQNARLEPGAEAGSGCSFFAGTVAAIGAEAVFDLLLVNVLPERIVDDPPRLFDLLAPGGLLVSSGNLLERRDEILERFAGLGLRAIDEATEGEWVAFVLETCRPCS